MEMMRLKRSSGKWTAFALAGVLSLGTCFTASANETATDSVVRNRVVKNGEAADTMRVVIPTDAAGIFDFILDPQELISQTNASAYEGKTFEEGATLFFRRTDGEVEEDYSSTSDAVTITNHGPVPIEAVVTASISVVARDEFAMTDDREFIDDMRPSVYLALTDGESELPILLEEETELSVMIPPEGGEEENAYSFRLTGACNRQGDWSRMRDITFEVSVTWVMEPVEKNSEEEDLLIQQEDDIMSTVLPVTPVTPSVVSDSNASSDADLEGVVTPSVATSSDVPKDIEIEKEEKPKGETVQGEGQKTETQQEPKAPAEEENKLPIVEN